MNWYGHLALAWDDRPDPVFALAAALPDLARLAGCPRVGLPSSGPVADGVAHHHEIDDRFHHGDAFRRLLRAGTADLEARGLRRGVARAAAHVGIELHLDGVLSMRDDARALLDTAFAAGHGSGVGDALEWDAPDRTAFADTLDRLGSGPYPTVWQSEDEVAARVIRVLSHRPRLRPIAAEEGALLEVLRDLAPAVRDDAEALLPR